MKTILSIPFIVLVAAFIFTGCKNNKNKVADLKPETEEAEKDTTIYGVCGEGTAMHSIELITESGDTLNFMINDEDVEPSSSVVGGLLCGDRLAVISQTVDGEKIATKVINLTTLLGKWTSVDKNFEIKEGGDIQSNVKAESNPWTSWKILNGHLLLNKDTFDIDVLGADSLSLENKNGIFVYKRQK